METSQERANEAIKHALQPFRTESIKIGDLRAHPQNYQTHPQDELEHIKASLRSYGLYRPVVVSADGYILAGHGVTTAAEQLGWQKIEVYKVPYDHADPRAIKLLIADNEVRHLAIGDDLQLTELLRDISQSAETLLGTGYDEAMLANLIMVTRPASEIEDIDAAAEYIGMPTYDMEGERERLIVNFQDHAGYEDFCKKLGLDPERLSNAGTNKSIWWPPRGARADIRGLRFTETGQTVDDLGDEGDEDDEDDAS